MFRPYHPIRILLSIFCIGLACFAQPSVAHDPFESTLKADICDGQMRVELLTNLTNAKALLGSSVILALEEQELANSLVSRLLEVRVSGAEGAESLTLTPDRIYSALAPPEDASFHWYYAVPASEILSLDLLIIDQLANNHSVSIYFSACKKTVANGFKMLFEGDSTFSTSLLVQESEALRYGEVFLSFFQFGFFHLLGGWDHLAFLIAILFTCIGLRQGLLLVSGFTLAHCVGLCWLVLMGLPSGGLLVELVIAASVVVMAVEVLVRKLNLGSRFALVVVFGVFHGLGFASGFRESGLDEGSMLVVALAGFNLAIELTQIAIVSVAVPLLVYVRHTAYFPYCRKAVAFAILCVGLWATFSALGA